MTGLFGFPSPMGHACIIASLTVGLWCAATASVGQTCLMGNVPKMECIKINTYHMEEKYLFSSRVFEINDFENTCGEEILIVGLTDDTNTQFEVRIPAQKHGLYSCGSDDCGFHWMACGVAPPSERENEEQGQSEDVSQSPRYKQGAVRPMVPKLVKTVAISPPSNAEKTERDAADLPVPVPQKVNPYPTTFVVHRNAELMGTDIAILNETDFVACQQACEHRQPCTGFTVNEWKHVCYLKTGKSVLRREPTASSGHHARDATWSKKPIRFERYMYWGLKGTVIASTKVLVHECHIGCWEDSQCIGFTFAEATCKMFSQTTGQQLLASGVSRLKRQPP